MWNLCFTTNSDALKFALTLLWFKICLLSWCLTETWIGNHELPSSPAKLKLNLERVTCKEFHTSNAMVDFKFSTNWTEKIKKWNRIWICLKFLQGLLVNRKRICHGIFFQLKFYLKNSILPGVGFVTSSAKSMHSSIWHQRPLWACSENFALPF